MKKYEDVFRHEACELLAELRISLQRLSENPVDQRLISRISRSFDTLTSMSAVLGFDEIASTANDARALFSTMRDAGSDECHGIISRARDAEERITGMVHTFYQV